MLKFFNKNSKLKGILIIVLINSRFLMKYYFNLSASKYYCSNLALKFE